jgi:hypothetical protein
LAIHAPNVAGEPLFVARRIDGGYENFAYTTPLVDNPPVGGSVTTLGRGSVFGDSFVIPAGLGISDRLIRVTSPQAISLQPFALASTATDSYTPQSFVAVGFDNAVVVGRGNELSGSLIVHAVRDGAGLPQVTGSALLESDGQINQEVYGGHGVFCARIENNDFEFQTIYCARLEGADFTSFDLPGPGFDSPNLRIFGDADYIYVAKFCAVTEPVTSQHVRVIASPWTAWTEDAAHAAVNELLSVCPTLPIPQ